MNGRLPFLELPRRPTGDPTAKPNPVETLEECEAVLARHGLATVLPSRDRLLPCLLWEARGRESYVEQWDEVMDRVWRWKDDLPARRLAWAGRLFGDRVILLHRSLLAPFLRWRGMPGADLEEIYHEGLITREARRVAEALSRGEKGRKALRRESGLAGKADAGRFDRACRDLERRMHLTRAGRADTAAGWDSNAYALVRDWFPDEVAEARRWPPEEAREAVRAALEAAAPEATPRQLDRWMRTP